jgi:hypothetical protein
MGAVATFDYDAWLALYPEFSNVTEDQADLSFDLATLFLRNDGTGPVCAVSAQLSLLNMLTAHIAFIGYGDSKSGGATGLVGRISGATEGSVSVQTENQYPPGSAQWFQQTKYGAMFWQATAAFRTFRYRIGPGVYNGLGVGQNVIRQRFAAVAWLYPQQPG